ncbi:MAG: 2-oxoacid:acceptor oxidoreductase subunit alpha [Deltaproteobacteria bacterium]|nr:2-oxoacid:acceptor oxidoreductase subunit alpha [Deltaproteobacteria bacterium]
MAHDPGAPNTPKSVIQKDAVVIRFCGDSGDGMQLTGSQFTAETAVAGNDLATLPDYPAEIRAPAGSLFGVSGFQLHFSSYDIYTPGDNPNVLVAMNPAALKSNVGDLEQGGILIVDREAFSEQNLKKAGYAVSPLEDGSLAAYQLFPVDVTTLTTRAVAAVGLPSKAAHRCRNLFCLGLTSWLFHRPIQPTIEWLQAKFAKDQKLLDANVAALKAGYFFAETAELFATSYEVRPAAIAPGTYRNATGTVALSLGLIAAAERLGRPLFLGAYPITPASDLLHELARHKAAGVITFQAEDEIAAAGAALGAAYGGLIGVTATSGPGLDLKAETIGLGVMVELPMVICDIQRAGPSTGLPTKTEQADLHLALFGRHGECPLPVIAAGTVADCFDIGYEAVRLAVKYMTPVIVLSDTYLANGAEPWRIPDVEQLPEIVAPIRTDANGFQPYLRDEATLARPWAVPGTKGLEHRIGGLEKEAESGNVSYSPTNHEFMVQTRAEKIARIAAEIPPTPVFGPREGDLLVVGWGSTFGSIRAAVELVQREGMRVAQIHLRYLNPLPSDLDAILRRYAAVVVPELNRGQLARVLRAEYAVDVRSITKIQGKPFRVAELAAGIRKLARADRQGQKSA